MAAESPLVSVLLPVRDGADHLPDCIASLEAQSLDVVEFVAVDDGSADATPDLLARWAGRDARVRLHRQRPTGIVAALEAARARARAPWLARMDADDVAHPARLARQLDLVQSRPELAGCGCRVEYFPREAVRSGARRYEAWINGLISPDEIERDLFVECPLPHPTFFLSAEAVARVGGYRERGWPEDYDLLLRLWRDGGRFAKVPDVLLRWREGDERLSRVHDAYSQESFRRCKVHHLQPTLLAAREGAVIWGAGPVGKAFSRTLREVGGRLRAFVELDPRKIGQRIHGVPVIGPDGVDHFRDALVLAAVGQAGARAEIRDELRRRGWREGEEFVAVA